MNGKKTVLAIIIIVLILGAGLIYSVNPDVDFKDRIIEIVDKGSKPHNFDNKESEYGDDVDYSTPYETPIDFFVDDDQTPTDVSGGSKKPEKDKDNSGEGDENSDQPTGDDGETETPEQPRQTPAPETNKLPIDILE